MSIMPNTQCICLYALKNVYKSTMTGMRKKRLIRNISSIYRKSAKEKLKAIEDELIQSKTKTRQDTLNHPAKLNGKLAYITGIIASAPAAPTTQAYAVYD